MKKLNSIILAGLLLGLNLIITVASVLPTSTFKLGGFPIILSGFLLGPATGFLVGGLADIFGFLMRPHGPFHAGFILSSALTGMIPALLLKNRIPSYLNFLWTVFIGQMVTSVLMVGYIVHTINGLPLWLTMGQKFIPQVLHVCAYAFIFYRLAIIVDAYRERFRLKPVWKLESRSSEDSLASQNESGQI